MKFIRKLTKKNKNIVGLVTKEEVDGDPCWDTHKQVGMKKKGGKMVPNCVPKEEKQIGGGNLKKLAVKATKRIDADVDGDVDTKDGLKKQENLYHSKDNNPTGDLPKIGRK